ncbi:MAG TPA: 4Fe-4S binding protein, partial [Candidatus Krumholzibacteriaceae bacterium]|nr:4Fe-4S binding protein [Candidatus Krumholzibacteriaceae bacterium]
TYNTLKEEIDRDAVSVVITNRPCMLFPQKIKGEPFRIDTDKCIACGACFNVGCPAISGSGATNDKGKPIPVIDPAMCTGCGICAKVCPTEAIVEDKS